jgi:hypothetical protein
MLLTALVNTQTLQRTGPPLAQGPPGADGALRGVRLAGKNAAAATFRGVWEAAAAEGICLGKGDTLENDPK